MTFRPPHDRLDLLLCSMTRSRELAKENHEARVEYDKQLAREQAKDDAEAKRK